MIPFIGLIPGGMCPGKKLSFHGMVTPTCNRFSINLQCGPNCNPRDDLALHMNFRYDAQVPYVVRNTLLMQQWGLEEGHGYLSFARGQPFEIRIDAEHDHFKIYFNGHHFTDFKYRVPLQRVLYLTIDGEVVMHSVKVDGHDIPPHWFQQPTMGYQPFGMPPGGHPLPMYPTHPVNPGPPHSAAIPVAAGVAAGMAVGAAMTHPGHYPADKHAKKAMKKQKKAMKKAMKHHKHSHHDMHGYSHHHHHGGHHGSSSSSSSSSSSEEE